MKYLLIVILVAAIAAIGFVSISLPSQTAHSHSGNFREWIKNPDYKQAAVNYFSARKSLRVPSDISDSEIRRMVERLFIQQDDDFNFERLKLVGQKAEPFLIEALTDSRTASTVFQESAHALTEKSPFERICELLEPTGPPAAVMALTQYIAHDDSHFRKYAAAALGNIGTAECIAPMLKALEDRDDYVRAHAMQGIEHGINEKRASPDFLNGIFPALVGLLNRRDESISGDAPRLLLVIDSDRAMSELLSDQYLSVENSELRYLIKAINEANRTIPLEKLLPLLRAVQPFADKYPFDDKYAEILIAYARNPDESAELTIRAGLKSTSDDVGDAAAQALFCRIHL